MQCPRCGEEILLATRCPYCGTLVNRQAGASATRPAQEAEDRRDSSSDAEDADDTVRRQSSDAFRVYRMGSRGGETQDIGASDDSTESDRPTGSDDWRRGAAGGGAAPRHKTGVWQRILQWYRLFRDPHSPAWVRYLPLVALIYLLFPFDLLPDLIPLVGWLDDATLIWLVIMGVHRYMDSHDPRGASRPAADPTQARRRK